MHELLNGRSIGLVFLGGSSDQVNSLVRTAVTQAGGNLTTVVAVREPLDWQGIAHAAAGTHYASLASSTQLVERFGELVGRQLVSGGQLVDRELLSRVRGSLLSAFDGQLTRLEGLVVVRAEPSGMSAAQSEASAAFESGLLAGVAAVGVPAVGVELTQHRARRRSRGTRARASRASTISTTSRARRRSTTRSPATAAASASSRPPTRCCRRVTTGASQP